jgi:hypothetical protein
MKGLAMSVLVSTLSAGAMASMPDATNALRFADIAQLCEQQPQSCSSAEVLEMMKLNAHVAKMLIEQAEEMTAAYYDILDMDEPETAFDEDLDALEVFVRGMEELAKKQYAKLEFKLSSSDNEEALSSARDVLVGIVRLRTAIYDLNGLAKQCLSDEVSDDCAFEPSEDFYASMHAATNTAFKIH